jgi:phosphopantothenoylcysteine synthetase/decarboxylase
VSRVLYILACAAPPARDVGVLVKLAQERGWDVCVVTSASGRAFVDTDALEAMTGHPVRSDYKDPGEPEVLPPADAMIVAPTTTNTINKWAAGISDTLVLGLVVEGIGKRLPIVAMPFTNRAQAAHPVFEPNIDLLRSWGVTVLYGPEVYPLHEPGAGWQTIARFPWRLTLDALDALAPQGDDQRA